MPDAITVVITTKDRPDYLRQALESVTHQTVAPKVIIVDDGSITPVVDQLERSATSSCTILRNACSAGVSAARNQGAEAATDTTWLVFLDDDDWLDPRFCEAILNRIADQSAQADFIWSSRVKFYEEHQRSKLELACTDAEMNSDSSDEKVLTALMEATCSGMAFKRSAFLEVGGFDENLTVTEDRDLTFKLLSRQYTGRPENNAKLYFRIHGGPRLSRDEKKATQARSDLLVIERYRSFLEQHPGMAERFLGRVSKRLWDNQFRDEALRIIKLQCQIAPFSIRARKRQLLWSLANVIGNRPV